MLTVAEMLEELTEAVENYNNARHFPAKYGEANVAYDRLLKSMRRARSRLNHRDSLETAYNRLRREMNGS